ncbi:ClpP/crotonase-like domain-containing protein [Chytridium lagenaria]|nr:ClpP/crotonase-like domain-containing protein [Chytridium lagenaria]
MTTATTTTAEPFFLVERDEVDGKKTGVVTIQFNRPKNLNALGAEMGREFQSLITTLSNDPTLRCAILTGTGRAFSAGGDLAFLRARTRTPAPRNAEIMRSFYSSFLHVRQLPVPVIAAINGHAIGAGACLALACDIRVMAEGKGRFGLNFVRIGLTPGMGGTHMLPRVTNPQVASRLILTGDLVDAKEAASLGLILKSVPGPSLLPECLSLARRIASASPIAVRGAVRSLRLSIDDNLERALWREAMRRDLRMGVGI